MSRRVHAARELPDELRAYAHALHPGESATSMLCPVCGGGRTGERSLALFRTADGGTVRAHCFRAGCGWQAAVLHDPQLQDISKPAPYQPKLYRGELVPCSDSMARFFSERYYVLPDVLRLFAKEAGRRVAYFLAFDPWGGERGGVLRNYNADYDGPKVITYKHTAAQFIGWYRHDTHASAPVVIVEDSVSAMRIYQEGVTAVCLFGTNINQERAQEIASVAGDRQVFLALDRDAHDKAVHYAKRLRGIVNMIPLMLRRDIKDTPPDEVRELLYG